MIPLRKFKALQGVVRSLLESTDVAWQLPAASVALYGRNGKSGTIEVLPRNNDEKISFSNSRYTLTVEYVSGINRLIIPKQILSPLWTQVQELGFAVPPLSDCAIVSVELTNPHLPIHTDRLTLTVDGVYLRVSLSYELPYEPWETEETTCGPGYRYTARKAHGYWGSTYEFGLLTLEPEFELSVDDFVCAGACSVDSVMEEFDRHGISGSTVTVRDIIRVLPSLTEGQAEWVIKAAVLRSQKIASGQLVTADMAVAG